MARPADAHAREPDPVAWGRVWPGLNEPQAGADAQAMRLEDLVLVQGMSDTRRTLAVWNRRPWPVVRDWVLLSAAITIGLLGAVWIIGVLSPADPSPLLLPGLNAPVSGGDVLRVLGRNSLVLALHGFACVAGFIAGSSLPLAAERYSGTWRWIHDRAGPLAIGFVVGATSFSLLTQAFVLGGASATISSQLRISNATLLVGLLPHAVPELVALFLPLAAWIIASRRGHWNQLLAATFVTVGLAVPVLVTSAFVETFLSPHLLAWLAGR